MRASFDRHGVVKEPSKSGSKLQLSLMAIPSL